MRHAPIRTAPARTNSQLPPGSTALEPMSGWRRLPHRTRKAAKTQIFMPRTVAAENLAGDQDGRLDVVADHAHLSIDDAPVERFGRVPLRELRVIGHRDVAAGVDARLVPWVETLLRGRGDDAELPVDR